VILLAPAPRLCTGILATQSNDFALGLPIASALYSESNPSYISLLYVIAPVSLVVINPIGFLMAEIGYATGQQEGEADTPNGTQQVCLCARSNVWNSFSVVSGRVSGAATVITC
jgi:hypothetical protein